MPLSDREQKILDEIERNLLEHDPKFARGVATKTTSTSNAQVRLGVALFAVGFIALIAFFITAAVPVGVGGFVLMLAGATLALRGASVAVARRRSGTQRASLSDIFVRMEGRLRDMRGGGDDRD
ncbi:MAG TPA: DUF3040 domain-containing protein [Actinomycetota bacterium]|nr:DUF3040 domain-containing protein [Actinomycetota bacterium]